MDALTAAAFAKLAGKDMPRIDPRTGAEEERVRIRVVCRPETQVLPGGHLVYRTPSEGERDNIIEVYLSEFDKIESLVETSTSAERKAVETELERRQSAWKEANPAKDVSTASPHSLEGAFRYVMGRDMHPIVELEVLKAPTSKGSGKAG